jgi:Cytochrome P450
VSARDKHSNLLRKFVNYRRKFFIKLGAGLIFNDGDAWKSHRRFSLKTLKDFGFGKKSLESVLLEESDRMVDFLVEKNSEPIYVQAPMI